MVAELNTTGYHVTRLEPAENPYARLEQRLGYAFRDRARLESALTHKSFVNENPTWPRADNERLEFLGDAVLGLTVAHLLMEAVPERAEGELSRLRAAIVSEQGLADVAAELDLGAWLFLGRGEEQSGGRRKPSVMADACEALIAAIYLDGGYPAAFESVRVLFGDRVRRVPEAGAGDFKTKLQERAARRRMQVRYTVVDERGPDHDKTFEIAASLGDREYARASGKTKKEAEQRAAAEALRALDAEADPVASDS
jgi:ribonuclease III